MEVLGRESHSGTTALKHRTDALLAAAQMIVASREAAVKHGGLATTGILDAKPGSVNTIPGRVSFSMDVRSSTDQGLETLEDAVKEAFALIAQSSGASLLGVSWMPSIRSQAVRFNERAIACVQASCKDLYGDHAGRLTAALQSGAGHDSVYTSRHAPTAMIFVPCKDGLSHTPL